MEKNLYNSSVLNTSNMCTWTKERKDTEIKKKNLQVLAQREKEKGVGEME